LDVFLESVEVVVVEAMLLVEWLGAVFVDVVVVVDVVLLVRIPFYVGDQIVLAKRRLARVMEKR
jgi:hypothetical protein